MKLTLGNITKEYNLKNENEIRLMFSHLFLYYTNKCPFFINVLMTLADIENVQEKHKDEIAYTYYDYEYERIKIHLNYKKIEENNMDADVIMFLILHEYLHNYYYHFQRMKKQSEESTTLANIVMDYYVNELLYELFDSFYRNNGRESIKNKFNKLNINIVDQEFMEKLCKSYGFSFPYNFKDKPAEPVLFEEIKNFFPTSDKFKDELKESNMDNKLDNHDIAKEQEKEIISKINKKRKENGEPEISKQDLETLKINKIENVEQEVAQNVKASDVENSLIREKQKLKKKNPFLNILQLKRIINNKLREQTIKSYKRISRKRDNSQIIFKGKTKQEGKKVVIALDVSGSISDKDLQMFYEMLNGFIDNKKTKTALDIIYWSSCKIKPELNFHQNITNVKDLMKLKIHSSGGTEIEYLHEFIKEYYGKHKEKIVLINITDGYFWSYNKIPDECVQYYFILTEDGNEETVKQEYQDSRVKIKTIKEMR